MAQVIIGHPDGRKYEVSEKAFADLYEPFGFEIEGIVYNGANLPNTEANLAKANADPFSNPNDSDLSRENAARVVILADLEAEARQRLAAESGTPAKAEVPPKDDEPPKIVPPKIVPPKAPAKDKA